MVDDLIAEQVHPVALGLAAEVDTSERGIGGVLPHALGRRRQRPGERVPRFRGGKDFRAADAAGQTVVGLGGSIVGAVARKYLNVTLVRGTPYVWMEFAASAASMRFRGTAECLFGRRAGRWRCCPSRLTAWASSSAAAGALFADGTRFLPAETPWYVLLAGPAT